MQARVKKLRISPSSQQQWLVLPRWCSCTVEGLPLCCINIKKKNTTELSCFQYCRWEDRTKFTKIFPFFLWYPENRYHQNNTLSSLNNLVFQAILFPAYFQAVLFIWSSVKHFLWGYGSNYCLGLCWLQQDFKECRKVTK